MKRYTVTIQCHQATPATPAVYSPDVDPHAAQPPSCAGRAALAGWQRKEDAHQARHRRLLHEARPATPATFSFRGWFGSDAEPKIAAAIVSAFGRDPSRYPSQATVEVE